MAWFCNYYTCDRCGKNWTDEWSCMCDDDCPHCGARHTSPDKSDDLTEVIARDGKNMSSFGRLKRPDIIPIILNWGRFGPVRKPRHFLSPNKLS